MTKTLVLDGTKDEIAAVLAALISNESEVTVRLSAKKEPQLKKVDVAVESISTARKRIRRRRTFKTVNRMKAWSAEDRDKLKMLASQGLPVKQIGAFLGRTPASIYMELRKNGWTRVKPQKE